MKVLHFFSNKRWTGPAEPTLNLCVSLRRLGVEADLACSPGNGDRLNQIVEEARDKGVEPILDFHLEKHRNALKNWEDRRTLARVAAEGGYDLIHCHLNNAHLIAARGRRRHGLPVIRQSYHGTGFSGPWPYRRMLKNTAHLIEPSTIAAEHDAHKYHYDESRITVIPNGVDTARFDPGRDTPDARRWLDIPHDAFVVGIVARLQTHRHYGDFLEAFRVLVQERDNVHAIVVGRGTKQDQVALNPVKELGLEDRVHFCGYVTDDNYVGMLRAFDVKVYLVPGSDGTCRAVREAMAMGKPVIAADRGMLREIVDDGKTGVICDGTADGLLEALRRFAQKPDDAKAMGQAARQKAERQFALDAQARAVLRVYESVLGQKPAKAE